MYLCHFIEFTACPGGGLGGGGQPIPTSPAIRAARARAIYDEDTSYEIRKSHENPAITKLYTEFFTDGPCSPLSHRSGCASSARPPSSTTAPATSRIARPSIPAIGVSSVICAR